MVRSATILLAAATISFVQPAQAQETGMPTFNAPYRAFTNHEAGVDVSFPDGGGTAFEGHYRFGRRQLDIGFRAGWFDPGGVADTRVLLGASVRHRVISRSESFPLDGALVVGIGASLADNANLVSIPAGLSVGRRLTLRNSPVVIIPYAQPTLFLLTGDLINTEVKFALGLGADFRLSPQFVVRLSGGVGNLEGISLGAVWVR